MELILVYSMIAALAGMMFVFLFCLQYLLSANSVSSQFYADRLKLAAENIEELTKDFSAITKRASEANLSLGTAVQDFETKLKSLESRVNMLGQQVKHRA